MAREFQVPHSDLTLKWSARDLSLAMADLLAREDLGPCGQPHSVSTQPGAKDRYRIDATTVCGACAVWDEHKALQDRDPSPGVVLRLLDVTAPAAAAEPDAFGPSFD